ncbi:hypothetical protein ACNF49_21720 [Actinomadura sp. ATCC 39365]
MAMAAAATLAYAAAPAGDAVVNGSLDNGVKGWWASKITPIEATGGRLCAQVPAGAKPAAIVDGYPEVGTGSRTHAYQNTVKISDREARVLFQVGGADAPYTLCVDNPAGQYG